MIGCARSKPAVRMENFEDEQSIYVDFCHTGKWHLQRRTLTTSVQFGDGIGDLQALGKVKSLTAI
jgi:hypothetical protein